MLSVVILLVTRCSQHKTHVVRTHSGGGVGAPADYVILAFEGWAVVDLAAAPAVFL